jgi:glycine/D-amino acid oxidase-like deaminating enzyme
LAIGESVLSWSANDEQVEVVTDRATYSAARLIIAGGAWSHDLLPELGVSLSVRRKHLHWYATQGGHYSPAAHCPTYLYELPEGVFYGFPEIGSATVKVGEHSGGCAVTDPLHDARDPDPVDRQRVEAFLAECLPQVTRNAVRHETCFYTMSPDEHFIVDRHPARRAVVLAAGLSGHGFKFTPVLGEALIELAVEGASPQSLDFLGLKRLAAG